MANISETLNVTANETAKNVTGREAATPEGRVVAYSSLILMAVVSIFFGSFRSVLHYRRQKENGEKLRIVTLKRAAMFPIIASGSLLWMYMLDKDYLTLQLVSLLVLGVLALTDLRKNVSNVSYKLTCTEGKGDKKREIMDFEFNRIHRLGLTVSTIFGIWYFFPETENGEKPESMTHKDAAMFPIIASGALLGLYIVFKLVNEYNLTLLLVFLIIMGVLALTCLLKRNVSPFVSGIVSNVPYKLTCTEGTGDEKREIMDHEFDRIDLLCLTVSTIFGIWHLAKKHWIANNVFGLAFAVIGVERFQLNSVLTGCILLGELFIYDIFWVFGTDVMVTVAKSSEAPNILVFPMDILEKGLAAKNFAMLGLGDIAIPGIFIALLLRFDRRHHGSDATRPVYFCFTMVAYFLGLLLTVLASHMHVFKAAQPALLYLVPACLGTPILLALVRGEIKNLFTYQDHTEEQLKAAQQSETSDSGKEKAPTEPTETPSTESNETKKSL